LGYSDVQAALILSIIGGASIPGTLLLGRASDTIGRKKIILFCAVGMAIVMFLLVRSFNHLLLYLFAVVWGFFRGGISPPLTALVGDTFGLSHIGLIMAVTGIGWTIGAAAGPALAGYLFDMSSNYIIAFMASIIVLLITAILVSLLKTQNSSAILNNIQ
jgi:MFS family permease